MKKNIVVLNTNISTPNGYISKYIADDAKLDNVNVIYAMYYNVVSLCRGLNSKDNTILLCLDGQTLNRDIISQASLYCKYKVLWTFEDPYTTNYNLTNADLFDFVFSNDEKSAELYGGKGYFLPLAAPSEFLSKSVVSEKKYDVFFCGSAWPNRVVLLNKLIKDRPNLKFKIVLSYNSHLPLLPLNLKKSSYVGRISTDDFINYAMSSKITLNIGRCYSMSEDDESQPSNFGPRFYEIAATNSLQIINRANGSEEIEDDNIISYSSYDELLELVDKITLDNSNDSELLSSKVDNLRKEIAENHTYRHRVESILNVIDSNSNNIVSSSLYEKKKPTLLFVVHNVRDGERFGGLEVHQESIANYLKNKFEIFYFTVKDCVEEKRAVLLDTDYHILQSSSPIINLTNNNIAHPGLEKFYSLILQKYNVSLVHFFHFLNTAPSLALLTNSIGIPFTVSIHDFYCVCRQLNLLDYSGRYCNPASRSHTDCDLCMKKMYGFVANSSTVRSNFFFKVLSLADRICFISFSSMQIFKEKYYNISKYFSSDKIFYAPFPNNIFRFNRINAKPKNYKGKKKYVLLGNFYKNKGAEYFFDSMLICPNIDAEFHFWGPIDENIKDKLCKLGSKKHMFFFHGPYKPGQIDLTEYDFSIHLSIWPETYCQTLSEAWAARLIPIVTNLGALDDRVKDGINGLKVDYQRPGALVECLVRIEHNEYDFLQMLNNIDDSLFIEQKEHSDNYDSLFSEIIKKYDRSRVYSRECSNLSGFDLNCLMMKPRSLSWNQNFYAVHSKDIVYPLDATSSCFGKIKKLHDINIILTKGNIDRVDNVVFEPSKARIYTLKNDQSLYVNGWCQHPVDGNLYEPSVLILNEGNYYVSQLEVYKRPDLVNFCKVDEAIDFGIRGSFSLLTADECLCGNSKVYMGWFCRKINSFFTKNASFNVEVKLYA